MKVEKERIKKEVLIKEEKDIHKHVFMDVEEKWKKNVI